MLSTGTVFFVFNNSGGARLAANPDLLSGVDCVISVVPGINLDELEKLILCLTLEDALASFNISQRDISVPESAYCLDLLEPESLAQALAILGRGADESVRLALLNHVGLLTHNAFAIEALFKALVQNGLHSARAFRAIGRYQLVERPDIRTFQQVELGLWPQLEHLCMDFEVELTGVGSGSRLAQLKNKFRDILLLGYKGKTLLARSRRANKNVEMPIYDLAVVVRARTEVAAAEPILRMRAEQGHRDVMLVDDLIKSPDGTLAASASGRDWIALHSFSSPVEVVRIFMRCIALRGRAASHAMTLNSDRVSSTGFLGQRHIARQVLYTAFASVPELLVHRHQLTRALDRLRPRTLLSFDTVDRWGAMQGELARQHSSRSVMVQNTAADDMLYPWPLAMDHLVVGNERLREIFIASGAEPQRVHAFCLPLQDIVMRAGDMRLDELLHRAKKQTRALRVLIATQPFVQEYDYNAALLADFEEATQGLHFAIEWVLKPHPREAMDKYLALRDDLLSRGIDVTLFKGPFEAALSDADIVLSRTSTSLEYSALGGVPGIAHLNRYPQDIIERLDYLKSPVTGKSFDTVELRTLIASFAPHSRLDALRTYANMRSGYLDDGFPGRGRATEKVVGLIETNESTC